MRFEVLDDFLAAWAGRACGGNGCGGRAGGFNDDGRRAGRLHDSGGADWFHHSRRASRLDDDRRRADRLNDIGGASSRALAGMGLSAATVPIGSTRAVGRDTGPGVAFL